MAASIEHARLLRKRLTPQEVRVWVRLRVLRPIGFHFRRQAPIGPYIADFACLRHRLIIEIDGGHHALQPHSQWDVVRDVFFRGGGFRLLRFWNSDVNQNIDGMIETIVARLSAPTPTGKVPVDPPPPGEGDEVVTRF